MTGSVKSWLVTGTRRIPIDSRRRQGVHSGLRLLLTEDDEVAASGTQEISQSMKRQAVVEALRRLPAPESEVIKLAYFGGQTNDEIAATTGMAVASVRRRLRDGLRQMQAHLESTGVIDLAGSGRTGLASVLGWLATWAGPGVRHGRLARAWHGLASVDLSPLLPAAAIPVAAAALVGATAPSGPAAPHPVLLHSRLTTPVAASAVRLARVRAPAIPAAARAGTTPPSAPLWATNTVGGTPTEPPEPARPTIVRGAKVLTVKLAAVIPPARLPSQPPVPIPALPQRTLDLVRDAL